MTKKDLKTEEEQEPGFVKKPLDIDKDFYDVNSDVVNKKNLKKEKKDKVHEETMEETIDQHLTEIYENADGSFPDMTHFQKRKRIRIVTAFFSLLLACAFLGGVVWLGFFVIQPSSGFSQNDVILSISGDEKVQVGQAVRYRLRYRNDQKTDLKNVSIQVYYPEGFVLEEASLEPVNEAKDKWKVEDLVADDSGYIDIFGRLYGSVGQKQSFRVFFTYTPSNFSSEFQKVSHVTTELVAAPVDLRVEGPEAVVVGIPIDINVYVSAKDSVDLKNLALELESTEIFSIRKSVPVVDQFSDGQWSYPDLSEERSVKITGVFNSGGLEDGGLIKINLIGWKNNDKAVDPYIYGTAEYAVDFLQTDVSANMVINGATDKLTVQPGEALNTSLIIKNSGGTPIKNVVVRAVFDAPSYNKKSLLNWTELDDPADGDIGGEQLNGERRRGVITWDKGDVRDLTQLDSQEQLIIDFSLPIKSAGDVELTTFPNGVIEGVLEVSYSLNGKDQLISTQPIAMMVNSDTELEVRDTVLDKSHTMDWILTNSFHELENVVVEADLFGDITWNEDVLEVPAGEINFDATTKKLTWTVERVPTALDTLALRFGFELNSQNPTQTHLTSKITLRAKDSITGEEIIKVKEGVKLGE